MTQVTCKRGHINPKRNAHGNCKACQCWHTQQWNKRNPEKYVEATKLHSWKRSGIKNFTTLDYDRLYQVQQGCCAICKRHSTKFVKSLAVDHDHRTGKVRGLLCVHCNTRLSWFEDNEYNATVKSYLMRGL